MQDLSVTIFQQDLAWRDAPANRAQFERLLPAAAGSALALLPEMFATGFTMEPAGCAEALDGPTVCWLREQAARHGCAIAGSLAIEETGTFRNRFLLARPDGALAHYDKRHLFRMAREHLSYVAGSERRVIDWAGWRLCPQVCYDLRFPVWSRNRGDYDALLYVANWPARRREHWRALLVARAIENQAWVIGVNRTGVDGEGIEYAGDSLVIDPWGRLALDAGSAAGVHRVTLAAQTLAQCREKFPAHLDADAFRLDAAPD
ncbi:MAG: amidohydrolase [Pseudomonadales bacterium]|jgi:predicted amidohydrolase|nr:amidohydrolase [Pseudomonadales bacterium]MBP9033568.1 amidohydrolase [Pseudomonadales bacterium]